MPARPAFDGFAGAVFVFDDGRLVGYESWVAEVEELGTSTQHAAQIPGGNWCAAKVFQNTVVGHALEDRYAVGFLPG